MPEAALIATALTTQAAHPYSLLVGGVDVIGVPGGGGQVLDAPVESITLTEAGVNGVSEMEFLVEDPTSSFSVQDGQEVLFTDNAATIDLNKIMFRGRVDSVSTYPDASGLGRIWRVGAIGIESWLDWLKWTDVVLGLDTGTYANPVGTAIAASMGTGSGFIGNDFPPVQVFLQSGGTNGTLGAGIASSLTTGAWEISNQTITRGMSLREVISIIVNGATTLASGGGVPVTVLYTLDWWYGLRAWPDKVAGTLQQPDDYTTMTITDTYVGALASGSLDWDREFGQTFHEVYVRGSAAANSGYFSDGSGIRGQQVFLNQSLATSPALAQQYAQSLLTAQSESTSGTFVLEDVLVDTVWAGVARPRAGGIVTVTDSAIGLSSRSFRISEIGKTFSGARQTWKVSFGTQPPSAMNILAKPSRLK